MKNLRLNQKNQAEKQSFDSFSSISVQPLSSDEVGVEQTTWLEWWKEVGE